MFRREPDTRRVCPVCKQRISVKQVRYCNNCEADFSGSWIELPPSNAELASTSFLDLLGARAGYFVYVDLTTPFKPVPVLLAGVHLDYVTFSYSGRFVHLPVSSVYAVVEQRGQVVVFLRHEYEPIGGATDWVGFSLPKG